MQKQTQKIISPGIQENRAARLLWTGCDVVDYVGYTSLLWLVEMFNSKRFSQLENQTIKKRWNQQPSTFISDIKNATLAPPYIFLMKWVQMRISNTVTVYI